MIRFAEVIDFNATFHTFERTCSHLFFSLQSIRTLLDHVHKNCVRIYFDTDFIDQRENKTDRRNVHMTPKKRKKIGVPLFIQHHMI